MADAKIVLTAVDQTKAAFLSAQKNLAGLGEQVAALPMRFGAIGAAIAAAFSAVTLKGAIDTLDRLDDLSEKTGIAVESLSALRYAGEVSGTPLEAIATGVRKLSINMAAAAGGNREAEASFKALGISVKNSDGSLRSQDDVLLDLADKFSGFTDGAGKAAWAVKIFGKSGEEMIPLLNLGRDGIVELRGEAEKLGAVYGGDLAKQAAEFNDNLKKLSLASEAAKVSLAENLIPSLNDLIEEFLIGRRHVNGFLDALLTLGTINPFKTQASNMEGLREEIAQLEAAKKNLSKGGFANLFNTEANINAQLDKARRQYAYLAELQDFRAAAGKGLDLGGAKGGKNKPGKTEPPKMPDVKPPDHFADNFINQLITQYANLSGQMSKTEEVTRQLDLATEKFTATQRKEALNWAHLIDERMNANRVLQAYSDHQKQVDQDREAAVDSFNNNVRSLSELSKEYEFQAGLIGKTAEQSQRLTAVRQIDLQLMRTEIELGNARASGLINQAEYMRLLGVAQNSANAASEKQLELMARTEARLRDPKAGITDALLEYERTAARVGESMKNVFSNAFRGMEDSLVNFVKTGKLDFASLADSIISDLIRIQVQQSVTKPLAQAMSTFDWSSMFAFAKGGSFTNSIVDSPTLFKFAQGTGLMGEAGPEAIMPLSRGPDGSLGVRAAGGGNSVVVNVIESPDKGGQQSRRSEGGVDVIDIYVEKIKSAIAGDISRGSGAVPAALGRTYGLNRVVGAY